MEPSDDLELGLTARTTVQVIISNVLTRPYYWEDMYMDYVFGPYSRVKHEYCIRKLGWISHKTLDEYRNNYEAWKAYGKYMDNFFYENYPILDEMPLLSNLGYKINMENDEKIQLIIWSILVLCVGACTEDKGDYDYIPLNDLVVQGIEKDYTVEQFSSLKIPVTITVKDGFSEDHYEYLWYIWRVNNTADPDTLSFKKDLDVEVESVYWGVLDEIHCNRQRKPEFSIPRERT